MIEAELPDGTVLEFPEGTADDVIDRTVKQHLQKKQPQGSTFDRFAEPARAMAQGMAGEVVGGLTGLGSLLAGEAAEAMGGPQYTPDMAVDQLNRTREFFAYDPKTQQGQQGMKAVAGAAQSVDQLPGKISGTDATISGAMEDTRKQFGDRAMRMTGSPELAAGAYVIPDAILSVIGMRGIKGGATGAKEAVPGLFDHVSPTKRRIAQKLSQGSTDADTAEFMLTRTPKGPNVPANVGDKTSGAKNVINYLRKGGPKVAKDPKALEAVKQGFDKGVIAVVKGASPTDRQKMLSMTKKMKRGKENAKFAMTNRPADVAGDSLMARYNAVKTTNKKAGNRLDSVAEKLKGKSVNYDEAMASFLTNLKKEGVSFGDGLKPVFQGSRFEGSQQAERILSRLIQRMSRTRPPDAYDIHRLKGYIDEMVDYGKSKGGLTGRAENIVKQLRRELDQTLDQNFPEYNRVNTQYAETRTALDNFQKAAGTLDLGAENADKATGTLMRRLMSNAQSRAALMNSVEELQSTAKKYGATFDDDLMTQVLFADELDSVFGPVARTSFQGQIKQATEQGMNTAAELGTNEGMVKAGLRAAGGLVDKARNINEDAAFEAIERLLSTP